MTTYDDIVVGAGSSGAVLAARLSEDRNRNVLVVEAGPDFPDYQKTAAHLLTSPSWIAVGHYNWGFAATAREGRKISYPLGRVLGGTSAVNSAIALRGTSADFQEWSSLGNPDWAFNAILPFYLKLETDCDCHSTFHGTSGPISIERQKQAQWQPISLAFYEACRAASFADVQDHNDPDSTGIGPWPFNKRDGIRLSTLVAYLHPARHRQNLTIRPNCLVDRIILDKNRAVGVEIVSAGQHHRVLGHRVTLSAGAIGSPAILMRSGIGPASHLETIGVLVVVDLPGVGNNLIDHPRVSVTAYAVSHTVSDRLGIVQLGLRYTASSSSELNDMQLYLRPALEIGSISPSPSREDCVPVAFSVSLQRPRSRGQITLSTRDPFAPPTIMLNYLHDQEDVRRMIDGMQLVRRLIDSAQLDSVVKQILEPNPELFGNDAALAEFAYGNCNTTYHPVGTARMGHAKDAHAVVDQYCRVRGISGLRVVDASVMPNIVRANTNLTCMAIAERVSEWMRADTS